MTGITWEYKGSVGWLFSRKSQNQDFKQYHQNSCSLCVITLLHFEPIQSVSSHMENKYQHYQAYMIVSPSIKEIFALLIVPENPRIQFHWTGWHWSCFHSTVARRKNVLIGQGWLMYSSLEPEAWWLRNEWIKMLRLMCY